MIREQEIIKEYEENGKVQEVYLDNSATTRPYDEVAEYMNYINKFIYGNPSSLHKKGIEAEKMMKKARQSIADTLGASPKEIFFTSGGTESNNLAIIGYLRANPRKGKHVITSKIEHPSVLEVFKFLEENGYNVDYIDVDKNGIIDLEMLKKKISKETALISIMYVNNEIGSIQPIDEIVKIRNTCNKETVFHVDGVQAFGKFKINPAKSGIDLLTISSHKIHGPKGVGALYVNEKVRIKPIIFGGGQETLIRSGTENLAGICGFGLACEICNENINANWSKVLEINKYFRNKLKENIKDIIIISPEDASPYILNVSFKNIKGEVLLHHLEEKEIYISTGSACSSRKSKRSHVLQAMGLSGDIIDGSVRFSFSEINTLEEIDYTVDALKEIIPKIRFK
ncbi:MAG TPA: cysteine desulfurase [Clostridiaceae bacterium]|nr:cysteine desulfurase [Clostridiaceae bacterium]